MAIVQNKASEIGDIIFIKAEVPIIGLIALSSFTDTTENETGLKFFTKQFRYSVNGINYSPWIALTNTNLQQVQVVATDTVYLEYRYMRQGTDASGQLVFDNITLNGQILQQECGIAYNRSVFSDYFQCFDVQVLNWAVNVLQKLYLQGIVPAYIIRGQDDDQFADQSYIEAWKPITIFFAYLVIFARVFENFTQNEKLSNSYINQSGGYICGDEGLDELLYIISNQLRDRAERGGTAMYEPASGEDLADGELLRLICWKPSDDFLLGVAQSKRAGWNLGNSSPCYRGLTGRGDLNKAYETTDEVSILSKYPLINSNKVSLATINGKRVMSIANPTSGQVAGIGIQDPAKMIAVNASINYEITFIVRQSVIEQGLTFGVLGFDISGNSVPLINAVTNTPSSTFFSAAKVNIVDKDYMVRGIIYNKAQPQISPINGKTNMGIGTNLRFASNVTHIIPFITLDNTFGGIAGPMYLRDVKVTPSSTPYSRCFLNNRTRIDVFMKNNNGRYSYDDLVAILRKSFIPYNTAFNIVPMA